VVRAETEAPTKEIRITLYNYAIFRLPVLEILTAEGEGEREIERETNSQSHKHGYANNLVFLHLIVTDATKKCKNKKSVISSIKINTSLHFLPDTKPCLKMIDNVQ
jgi:hypothetical protein